MKLGEPIRRILSLERPFPVDDLGCIDPFPVGMVLTVDLQVPKRVPGMRPTRLKGRNAVDCVHRQSKSVDLVLDGQFHRRIDVALLLVAADVEIIVVVPPISQAMDQPRVGMEIEDDRLVVGE